MALLTWPDSDFRIMSALQVVEAKFYLSRSREMSKTGAATFNEKDMADPLWFASLQCGPQYHEDASAVSALIDTMRDQMLTFYVWNPAKMYPRDDPTGSKYGASNPVVLAKNADNKRISISGLVANYKISVGDFISIPSRKCLLKAVTESTANSSGQTGLIEVTPFIRPAVTAGDAIVLTRPYLEMKWPPGQDDYMSSSGAESTISFQAVQAL